MCVCVCVCEREREREREGGCGYEEWWRRVVSGVGEGGESHSPGPPPLQWVCPAGACQEGRSGGSSLQRHGPPEDLSVGHPPLGALEGAWQTHPLTCL